MTTPTILEERLKGMIGMLGEHNTAYWITPEVSEKKLTVMELLEQEISFDRATRDRELREKIEGVTPEKEKGNSVFRDPFFLKGRKDWDRKLFAMGYVQAKKDIEALLKDSKVT